MPMPWSRTVELDLARRRCAAATSHRASPASEYFTALSSRLYTRRHELAAVAQHRRAASAARVDLDRRCRAARPRAGSARRPRPRPGATATGSRERAPRRLDAATARAGRRWCGRPGTPRDACRSASRRGDRRGRPRRASVSASRPSAPTGVFSSWLMLATKSRRTVSSRRRSDTSSTTTSTPDGPVLVGQRHGPHAEDPAGRAEQVELALGRPGRAGRRRPWSVMASSTSASLWRAARNEAAGSLR